MSDLFEVDINKRRMKFLLGTAFTLWCPYFVLGGIIPALIWAIPAFLSYWQVYTSKNQEIVVSGAIYVLAFLVGAWIIGTPYEYKF